MRLPPLWLSVGALVIAIIAAAVPVIWVAAVLAVMLAVIAARGRERLIVSLVGLPLVLVSFGRFAFDYARPNFDAADMELGEKNAVSRLREIYWAESQARKFKLVDANKDGTGEYLSFPELVGDRRGRLRDRPPLLKPGLYTAVDMDKGIYQSEGYLFAIYLPGKDGEPTGKAEDSDPIASGRAFVAYAWPKEPNKVGHRAYFVDQYEQICVTENPDGFYGATKAPAPSAYALMASSGLSHCGQDDDPGSWQAWAPKRGARVKQARAER